MKIWVVMGESSEMYDDFKYWLVKAFKERKRAEEYAKQAEDMFERLEEQYGTKTWKEREKLMMNQYDPKMETMHDNVSYWAEEIELVE